MTDFMHWLYAHYIRPQLDASDPTGWETPLSLMETTLDAVQREHYERTREFYAVNAFLLGLRTGCGLNGALTDKAQ